MIEWLRELPDTLVFVAVICPILFLTLIAAMLPGRFKGEDDEKNSEGFDTYLSVASAAAVLLAFSLVQVDTQTRATDDAVGKEAAAINATDRVLTRFGNPQMTAMRPVLLDYASKLVGDEWPKLAHGGRSALADDLYTNVSKTVRSVDPATPRQQAMFGEALKYLDEVSDLREARINSVSNGLPGLFWVAAGIMVLLMIILVARLEPRPERLWTTGAVAVAIGVLLSLIIVIDAPFHGESNTVSPDAIKRAVAQMEKRG